MATNDFLPFGTGGGANVMTQPDYVALGARTAGFAIGLADPTSANKAWRQASFISAALAQAISDMQAVDTLDDADLAAMTAKIKRNFRGLFTSLTATGALTAAMCGLVFVSAAGGNVTLTLPAANVGGATVAVQYTIIRTDTSANTLNIARAGSDTINGATPNIVVPVGASLNLASNGVAGWWTFGATGMGSKVSITASGVTSQTVPTWATRARISVWGAGGGGGGCSAAGAARGGGGGEFRSGIFSVTPGASLSCTVGAGGARGTNVPTSGTAGGTTSVGSLISAGGGGGGNGSGGGVATGGGAGGTGGSGGDYAQAGAASELAYLVNATYNNSIGGGLFGGGYSAFVIASNGNDGWGPGIGGAGGANGAALGGNGAAGRIELEYLS